MPRITKERSGDPCGLGLPTTPIVRVRLSRANLNLLRRARDLVNKIIDTLPLTDDELYDVDDEWCRAAQSLNEILTRDDPQRGNAVYDL